jgi:hypothetical protein
VSELTFAVTVNIPAVAGSGAPAINLLATRFRCTEDENWSPFVQATVTAPLPTETAALAACIALDPTARPGSPAIDRVAELTITQTDTATGAKFTRPMRLIIRSRAIDHGDSTITLELESAESLLQDDAWISPNVGVYPDTQLSTLLGKVLARRSMTLDFTNSTTNEIAVPEQLRPWKPGVTAFDYVFAMVRTSYAFLWANETGQWFFLDRRPKPLDNDVARVAVGENLIGGTDKISRDEGWFNSAVLTYRWNDSSGTSHEAYDTYYTTAVDTGNSKVYLETLEMPYPGPGRAQAIVTDLLKRYRENNVIAVTDFRPIVGQLIDVVLPGTPVQRGEISAITWDLPADEMTIRTRPNLT